MNNPGFFLFCLLSIVFLSCDEQEQVYPLLNTQSEDGSLLQIQTRSPQTWSMTGSMHIARSRHTATLLPDGRVMVTGGIIGTLMSPGTTQTVELFDPATGTWSMGDDMATPRSRHTATLLQDGRVLVAGGRYLNAGLSAAELYDATTRTWSQTGSMHIPRDYHTATLLHNGKVLVAGGVSGGDGYDNPIEKSAEIYDPQTGMWTVVKHMAIARWGHSATLLSNGIVLVAGGTSPAGDGVYTVRAETYDPAADLWQNVDGLTTPRGFHTAIRLQDGNILVAGGFTLPGNATHRTATTEVFRSAQKTWFSVGNMTIPRGVVQNAAVLLQDGSVLIAGPGITAERYDPDTGTWNATGSMQFPRSNHSVTLFSDGRALATGGETQFGFVSAAEIYQPF